MMEGALHVCNICSRLMADPRMLPCGHSFCLKCLVSSSVLKGSSCPTCQIEFKIPDGGLMYLRRNEFIDKLVCLEHQKKYHTSGNHQPPLSQSSTNEERNLRKYQDCNEHLETMTLFCEDCDVALCSHCLTLKHKNHNFKHLSKYYDSKKLELEEHIKMKEECLITARKNLMNSEMVKFSNELKASNLKEEIQQRGEDLKKVIDSIVSELISKVDEHLKPYEKAAARVMKDLTSMISILNAHIKTLKLQLNSLSYKNVIETEPTCCSCVIIPSFSENANMAFFCSSDQQVTNLRKVFGNVGRDINLTSKCEFYDNVRSFTTNQDSIFVSEWSKTKVVALKRDNTKVRTSRYFLDEWFSKIHDLLIIGNTLFVSGRNEDHYFVVKVLLDSEDRDKVVIFKDLWQGLETFMKMSKSISQGNILLKLNYKLLLLSEDGDVINTIKLSFDVYDALEIRPQTYIVCCQEEVCIIDHYGDKVARYSSISSYQRIRFPQFVAKDKHGTIYIYDFLTKHVFVLDNTLSFVSSHRLGHLLKLSYDMERNLLLALSVDNILLTFSL